MNKSIKCYEFDLQTIQTKFYIEKVNCLDYSVLRLSYADLVNDSRLGEDRQNFSKEFEQIQLIGEAINFVAKTLIFWMSRCSSYEKYDFKRKILNPFCGDFRVEIERMYSYSLS